MITVALFTRRDAAPDVINVKDTKEMMHRIDMFFYGRDLRPEEGTQRETSPWMNRKKLTSEYIVIPKNIEYDHDIEYSTDDMFAVVKYANSGITEMEESDITDIKSALVKAITPEEKAKFRAESLLSEYYGIMFQKYRRIFAPFRDEHIERLRSALIHDVYQCHRWVEIINAAVNSGRHPVAANEADFDYMNFLLTAELDSLYQGLPRIQHPVYGEFESNRLLERALSDPKLKEMLIKALDPESIRICRSWDESRN